MGQTGIDGQLFPAPPVIQPCSWHECARGHRWPPDIVVAKCPGCGGSYLAIRQQACPFCNEPVVNVQLRVDFVPSGSGPIPRCKGAKPLGESIDLTIQRRAHIDGAQGWLDFTAKEELDGKKPSGEGGQG